MTKSIALLALPLMLASCATPRPPVAFSSTDSSALILRSLDRTSCQVLAPTPTPPEDNAVLLDQATKFASHQTAVVILENYSEPKMGPEYRARTTGWFIGLRGLGYQHIYFLRGQGVNDPNGLLTMAEYL